MQGRLLRGLSSRSALFSASLLSLARCHPARTHAHTQRCFAAHFQQKFVMTIRILTLQPGTARTLLTILSAHQYLPFLELTKVLSPFVKAVVTTRKRSKLFKNLLMEWLVPLK